MIDYKVEAAKAALAFIKPHQVIGLGAGTTVERLIDLVSRQTTLASSITFTSSSFKTTDKLLKYGLRVQSPSLLKQIDLYFDGCDQFDPELNALKSGGGIHTTEKILASMANEFILMGDESKMVNKLDTTYPVVIEILPDAWRVVYNRLASDFPDAVLTLRISDQKDGAVMSEYGNLLADISFVSLTDLDKLNIHLKLIPGIVDHSLFYRMATRAIVAGEQGVRIILPAFPAA